MNALLPDVSLTELSSSLTPLEWVGMQGIDLPITLTESNYHRELHARVDAQVDLPAAHAKGIHMSRLYRLLDMLGNGQALTPQGLKQLLSGMIESHRDCESQNSRLSVQFELLTRRPALITPQLSGWKSYPVTLEASLNQGVFQLKASVTVEYSSTCPCSAALSRQLVEQGFMNAFAGQASLTPGEVAEWLRANATLATPHSQRSEARVEIEVADDAENLGLMDLIERIEQALGTPVQTAVKRADEQAFAALNGQNLMFVEDAARRIVDALESPHGAQGTGLAPRVHVRHIESLHPHDAVAWAVPRIDSDTGPDTQAQAQAQATSA